METICNICKAVLTASDGSRLQSAVWDSSLGIGALCERCYDHVKHCQNAGDSMINSAITMEGDVTRSYFDGPGEAKALAEMADRCFEVGLKFYMDGFDPDERY
jgi:hypothetical protein